MKVSKRQAAGWVAVSRRVAYAGDEASARATVSHPTVGASSFGNLELLNP